MDGLTILLIIVTLALLVFLYFATFRKQILKFTKKGDLSEKGKSAKPLAATQRMAHNLNYQVVAPAHLAKDGKYADLDFILVGYFGVLGVKCLGQYGEVYGSAGDVMWLQVNGDKRVSFANPLKEAEADARVIRSALFAAKLKNVPVDTVCVFTNPNAELALPRNTGHYTVKEFKKLLGKDKFQQDKRVDIEATVTAIRAALAEEAS